MGELATRLAEISGAEIVVGSPVRDLDRDGDGWRVDGERYDAVVLAVPNAPARKLLAPLGVEVPTLAYASIALATFVFPADTELPAASGLLVPATERRLLKAATFLSLKWAHIGRGVDGVVVRCSAGRAGRAADLARSDVELAGVSAAELTEATGVRRRPLATSVVRWGGGLPQYAPGHLDRVAAVRATLPPGARAGGCRLGRRRHPRLPAFRRRRSGRGRGVARRLMRRPLFALIATLIAAAGIVGGGVAVALGNESGSIPSASPPRLQPDRNFAVAAPGNLVLRGGYAPYVLPCGATQIRASAVTRRSAEGVVGVISIHGRGCGLQISPIRLRLLGSNGRPLLVGQAAGNPVNAAFSVRPDIVEGGRFGKPRFRLDRLLLRSRADQRGDPIIRRAVPDPTQWPDPDVHARPDERPRPGSRRVPRIAGDPGTGHVGVASGSVGAAASGAARPDSADRRFDERKHPRRLACRALPELPDRAHLRHRLIRLGQRHRVAGRSVQSRADRAGREITSARPRTPRRAGADRWKPWSRRYRHLVDGRRPAGERLDHRRLNRKRVGFGGRNRPLSGSHGSRHGERHGRMAESEKSARELNDEMLYCCYAVFRAAGPLPEDRGALIAEAEGFLEQALAKDVYTRGTYDISGYRADADLLIWWTCPDPDVLQETYSRFRATALGSSSSRSGRPMACTARRSSTATTSLPTSAARTRASTSASTPSCARWSGTCCPITSAAGMLAEHGIMGREFEDVRANTVAAFGLGDYEWLLAFEADELHRIVDCIRHLRSSRARLYTKLEIPFYTGVRKPLSGDRCGLAVRLSESSRTSVCQRCWPTSSPMSSTRVAPSAAHPAPSRNSCMRRSPSNVHIRMRWKLPSVSRSTAAASSRLPWPSRCSAGATVSAKISPSSGEASPSSAGPIAT